MHAFILSTTNTHKDQVMTHILSQAQVTVTPSQYFQHPDLHHLLPQEGSNTLKIEQVRTLQQALTQHPFSIEMQLGIVWEAHLLSLAAANSLLKLLEEPTKQTLLFLVTSKPALLLPTIQSRCQLIALVHPAEMESMVDAKFVASIEQLNRLTLTQRVLQLEPHTKDRTLALAWLTQLIQTIKSQVVSSDFFLNNSSNRPLLGVSAPHLRQIPILLKNAQIAYNDVSANVNTKLVFDQLAICWDQQELDETG